MASLISNSHARKEDSRTQSVLSLPLVMQNRKQDLSIESSRSTPESASPTGPQLPRGERKKSQPSFRQTRFRDSPLCNPVSVQTGAVSVQDVHDSIVKEVPHALVAHVHDGAKHDASSMIAISSSLDFGNAFKNSSPSFILVDSCEHCANLTIDMLSDQAGQSNSAVIIVLVQKDVKADIGPIVNKVPAFVDSGADDVIVIPIGVTNLSFSLAVSLAKAEANRYQKIKFKGKIQASNNQCNSFFWKDVHDIFLGFPRMRPQLHEICGSRVGNRVLVGKLGEGAFGSVYKWEHETQNTSGAVKVFVKSRVYSAMEAFHIATECALLQRLTHENVVAFTGAAHGMQCVYLFMEFAGSRSLFQVICTEGARGLPLSRARGFFSQIAAGVAHCHEMLVAHCDLKPENIVTLESGCAKIVDFGQAVDLAQDVPPLQGPKGTMPFMAPEIMRPCSDWDPCAADVWALAVTLMEMLCGKNAFVHLLDWHSLGRELTNPSKLAQRADELKVFFAKDETTLHGNALLAISGICHDVPPPFVFDLWDRMFELMPEQRISVESVAEYMENISD